jgi:HAD superfamily hydrolase (TIGR01509 family)
MPRLDAPTKLAALIFDVDGTLADTERDGHRVAFNGAFADAGLRWHWDEARYNALLRVTGGKERIRWFAQEEDPDFLARPDAEDVIAALHADKTARYVDMVSSGAIGLRPGVEGLIREARAEGLTLAIATTTTPANVTALLTSTLGADAESWFAAIGAADSVTAKKPAPDVYEWVLGRLDLAPDQCLAFEDSGAGLAAARGAGLRTVVTPSEHAKDDDFAGALTILPDLSGVSVAQLRDLAIQN